MSSFVANCVQRTNIQNLKAIHNVNLVIFIGFTEFNSLIFTWLYKFFSPSG